MVTFKIFFPVNFFFAEKNLFCRLKSFLGATDVAVEGDYRLLKELRAVFRVEDPCFRSDPDPGVSGGSISGTGNF